MDNKKKLEKKKTKIKTKKNKKYNRKLINAINCAYALFEIIYDENGNPVNFKYLDINKSFEKTFGLFKKEIIGKNITEFLHERHNYILDKYKEAVKSGKTVSFEYNIGVIQASLKIKVYKFKKNKFVSIIDDVSDRKRLNNKLLKQTAAIDQSANSIVITDTAGNIEYVNKKFTKTTGYTFLEAIGKNPRVLKSGNQPKEYYEQLWDTISSGESWRGVFHNKRKDGSLYWESAVISPVVDENGKTINYLAVKEDITDKKKLEQDLILAKEKAEQSDKLKSSFLANVSHEIRTPLNAIIGFSEFLVKDISLQDKKLYGEIVKNSSNDLLNIINDILDIAKIEAGHAQLQQEEFSINQLLTELFEYFKYKKDKLNKERIIIKFNQKLSKSNENIISDKGRIKQVLINLLENAFKFTSDGFIEFGCILKSDSNVPELEIFVEDSGIGISKEKQEFIFDRFRQADESTSRRYGGTGLGLSISRSLAKLIGGDLTMSSNEGKGSRFLFNIPYKPVVTIYDEQTIEEVGYKIPKGKKILIVEDVYSNFELVNEILEEFEPIVLHAVSGLKAIELFKKNNDTDLILMDIRLPDIDGFEVTNIIKSIKPDVPVIALTAYAMKSDKESAMDAGCDDFLTKPLKEERFLKTVEKYLLN